MKNTITTITGKIDMSPGEENCGWVFYRVSARIYDCMDGYSPGVEAEEKAYKMFEDSLKKAERKRRLQQGKPTSPPPIRSTKKSEAGCGTWLMVIIIVLIVLYFYLFGT